MRQYLGFLKGLLQDVVDILVNLVQLVLLDVALLQQPLGLWESSCALIACMHGLHYGQKVI